MKIIIKILFVSLFIVNSSSADVLITDNYKITIERHCEEYFVSCDDVSYVGVHKKTEQSIELKGSTWHTVCEDKITPCQFIGYIFNNDDTTYYVYEKGLLEVKKNKKLLLREEGKWE
jgi:hypothetical protein